MRYETEGTIRRDIAEALRAKRMSQKKEFDPRELESDVMRRWFESRVKLARQAKRLLTEQQHADVISRRELQVDDRVRYVGPTRLEVSPRTRRNILRPHGQTGHITRVERGAGGRPIFTFMPDIPKQTLDAAEAMDIEILALITAEWTELERVV